MPSWWCQAVSLFSIAVFCHILSLSLAALSCCLLLLPLCPMANIMPSYNALVSYNALLLLSEPLQVFMSRYNMQLRCSVVVKGSCYHLVTMEIF